MVALLHINQNTSLLIGKTYIINNTIYLIIISTMFCTYFNTSCDQ